MVLISHMSKTTPYAAPQRPHLYSGPDLLCQLTKAYKKTPFGQHGLALPPLLIAVWEQDAVLVESVLNSEELLREKTNPALDDTQNGYSFYQNETAMHFAARRGARSIGEILKRYGVELFPDCPSVPSPVHLAVKEGHVDFLNFLLENLTDEHKHVLIEGENCSRKEFDEYIKSEDSRPMDYHEVAGFNPILLACHYKKTETRRAMVKALLDYGDKPRACTLDRSPLCIAVEHDDLELAEMLLNAGANINETCEPGASPTSMDWHDTPIHLATSIGSEKMLKLLVSHPNSKGKINSNGVIRPIIIAIGKGDLKKVKLLLEYGDDPCCIGRSGEWSQGGIYLRGEEEKQRLEEYWSWTPLIRAADVGSSDIVNTILDYSHKWVESARTEVEKIRHQFMGKELPPEILYRKDFFQRIVDHGTLIDYQELECNYTALHQAVYRGHYEVVDALIKSGANLNFQSKNARFDENVKKLREADTPLSLATKLYLKRVHDSEKESLPSEDSLRQIIKLLIKAGANPNIPDSFGTSVRQYFCGETKAAKNLKKFFWGMLKK